MSEIKKTRSTAKKPTGSKAGKAILGSEPTLPAGRREKKQIAARSTSKLNPVSVVQRPIADTHAIRQAMKKTIEDEPIKATIEAEPAAAAKPALSQPAIPAAQTTAAKAATSALTTPPAAPVKPVMMEAVKKSDVNFREKPELAKQELIKVINEEMKKVADKPAPAPLSPKTEFKGVIKPTPTPIEQRFMREMKTTAANRPVSIYKKISISFVVLTALLLSVIFYFSFVKVKILIEPKSGTVSGNLAVNIYDENTAPPKDGGVVGLVKQIEVSAEKAVTTSGANVLGQEAVGRAKIINNYTKNQPLVATTRLLAPDNKLFRIKDTINVPAGGSIEVEIYADQPSAEMAIGPTKFTIPGLWAGLQDKIYAESSAAVAYQEKKQPVVAQADIDNGVKALKEELVKKADSEIGANYKKTYEQVLYKLDENSISSEADGKVGDEKAEVKIKVKAKVTVTAFHDDPVKMLAEIKLKNILTDSKELSEFSKDKIVYNLSAFDIASGTATVDTSFEGRATPKNGGDFIDKEKLVGLSADQLNQYLASLPDVASFEVKFSPSFIKKVPNLTDRITIELKSAD